MSEGFSEPTRLFFVIGPLRTGSSLMARCVDDHPRAICLCESEINRALFTDYFVQLHSERMLAHGFTWVDLISCLDRKKQDDLASWQNWYSEAAPRLAELYGKRDILVLGDKSPDLFRCPGLVQHLASNCPLIYTVRDPRAILRSIEVQADATPEDKAERWLALSQNYLAWRPYLNAPNVLIVRYEDLVTDPTATMKAVYSHLQLPYSPRFLEPFSRAFPLRFLWETAVEWTSGQAQDFDASRILSWKTSLSDAQLALVYSNPTVLEFMHRFGYER